MAYDNDNDKVQPIPMMGSADGLSAAHVEHSKQSQVARTGWLQALTPQQRDLAFDVIRKTREVLVANADKRQPSHKSKEGYLKLYKRLTKHLEAPGLKPKVEDWTLTLEKYIDVPSSFRAHRVALRYGLREKLREALAVQDRIQRAGGSVLDWLQQVVLLKSWFKILQHVEASDRSSPFWASKHGKRRQGTRKSQDLKVIARKVPNWASLMLEKMQCTKYGDATHVSYLAGVRPEELVNDVIVERDGPSSFAILINGAKVTESAGQPWRRLVFSNNLLPPPWQIRLNADSRFVVSIESTNAYSQSMSRVSKRELPGLPSVTPYVFRHALPDRLRDHGWPTDQIAAAMGHSVSETQALYGGRAGGGKRREPDGKEPISVESARPVRPLDRSGLESVIGKGKAHRKMKLKHES